MYDDDALADELGRSGLCVCPNFLLSAALTDTRDDLKLLQGNGRLKKAGIGAGNTSEVNSEIRRDEIFWLERNLGTLTQDSLWLRMDSLKQALNRKLFLGIREFEGHYAAYSPGGFYGRHYDSQNNNNTRIVSVVLYLNQNWLVGDGGELRVYDDIKHLNTTIDPIGGTLVCFLSKESEHEVLESFKDRLSFTGWFKT